MCTIKKLYRTATGLYADAFATDAKLADDLQAGHQPRQRRLLRGGGRFRPRVKTREARRNGRDPPEETGPRLARWPTSAAPAKQLEDGHAADLDELQRHLKHSQKDSDLAGLRDAAALAKLTAPTSAVMRETVARCGVTPE